MKQSQPAQFKRMTNIKVIKAQSTTQGGRGPSNGNTIPPPQQQQQAADSSTQPRVINVSMFQELNQQDSSSLGPPIDRTPVNHPQNGFKSVSSEPQTVRAVNNKRQLTFGSVKKVIKTATIQENTYAPSQIAGMGPSATTTAAKTKLYLPSKKIDGQSPNTQGVQLQDGHRRRLQALAAAQHENGHNTQQNNSAEGREGACNATQKMTGISGGTQHQTNSGNNSNSNSQNNRIKVINKKLITLSTKKERNATDASSTENVDNSKSVSSSRPAALNLNFNTTNGMGAQQQPSHLGNSTVTNQQHYHSSALSRFNQNPNTAINVKKQGGASELQTHRQNTQLHKTRSGHASVQEKPEVSTSLTNSAGRAAAKAQQANSNILMGSSIKIRQEISPNRIAYNSQPQGARNKPQFSKIHHQGGGLGYRRHQIIQDITDETSPQGKANYNGNGGYQRQMVKQSSQSSMKSLNQITQKLNKQSDLKKVFYAKIAQSPSNKSINTIQSNQSSGGPPSSQPSQQFTLTKKASLIGQDNSASTSRERTLNFKLKKHGQHGQLQNHKEKRQGGAVIQLNQQQQQAQAPPPQHPSNAMPSLGKRRPLVIRKNNFVLTKGGESSNGSGDRGDSGQHTVPTINNGGIQRVFVQQLGAAQIQPNANKLNMTLHSNNSGNRALNNTQKIGRAAQGGHGLNSNESMGSDASLSQTRNQLSKTLAAVNASIKKAQQLHITAPSDQSMFNSAPGGGSTSQRKTSEHSLEKLTRVNTGSSPIQPSGGSRLIKVNRSKKKLDTARRSRIQQLKDITLLDQTGLGGTQHPLQSHFASSLHQQSRGIPQLNRNHSNEIVKAKLVTPGKILQVQTDFNATLPVNIHKPAGSITIKADYSRKAATKPTGAPTQQKIASGSVERGEEVASKEGSSKSNLNVSNFNQNPQQPRNARNTKNNGLRPVRLFNYATSQATSAPNEVLPNNTNNQLQLNGLVNRTVPREKEEIDNKANSGTSNFKVSQPTPSSTKSQKSLRRGQIFRKQTRRNSQVNDEQQSYASKENSNGMMPQNALTHMSTPTDVQNASSSNLPLKTRRSNHLASQRQLDSDKNQQSSYFQSSSGDKVGLGTSKPDSQTNKSGTVTMEGSGNNTTTQLNGLTKPFPRQQVLKQFDSEGKLVKPSRDHAQQKSTNDLTMKNDHSELIVSEATLIQQQQNSAQQIIPLASRYHGAETNRDAQVTSRDNLNNLLQKGDMAASSSIDFGITKGVQAIEVSECHAVIDGKQQELPPMNTRRSLERVESIKNLHSYEDNESVYKDDKDWMPSSRGPRVVTDKQPVESKKKSNQKQRYPPIILDKKSGKEDQINKPAIIDKKMLILAPPDSGTNSGGLIAPRSKENGEDDLIENSKDVIDPVSSNNTRDEQEPTQPNIEDEEVQQNNALNQPLPCNKQQEELRIEYNETLPPPGPMSAAQVKKNQAVVKKFSVTKGAEFSRELMTQTADTSNRKTISNQRAYCNSSDSRTKVIGTAFSFKSQTSPEYPQEVPKFPMSPQQALIFFSNQLTDHEKKEILDYPEIYFIGAPTAQKVQGSTQLEHNYGYDDDKGDYKIITNDHIGYRFEIKSFLGKGSFGTAIKCFDHKTGLEIAVKVIKNKKKYYYQAGVELKILQFLKQNDPEDIMNVIHLNDFVIFRKHLCIGFELMSMNLFEFLKINDFNGFDHNLIRRFAIQLLYALKYLKMFQIIHCDLKPENILLKESNKSGIKIIDFGSSTFMDERVYTYIQSRFYRAPEIMLGIPYDCAIDMWSFGCIMAELYIGYPIFPGDSENDQMSRLMEMVGVPDAQVLSMSTRKDKFFTKSPDGSLQDPVMCKNSRGKLRKPLGKPLGLVIGDEDPDFTDFVEKCLCWNPHHRLTPDEALKHVWILKGLPPQVLIHHQKMHNIETPELPPQVLTQRNDFIEEQRIAQRTQEVQEIQKKQQQAADNQQRLQVLQTSATKASPSGTATKVNHHGSSKKQLELAQPKSKGSPGKQQSSSQEQRASGKIRLKRTAVIGSSGQTRNQIQQAYHTTNGRPPVLPPAQVIMQQPNIQQSSAYPGSTKSSHKGKSLTHGGKMTFKVQQAQQQQQPHHVGQQQQFIQHSSTNGGRALIPTKQGAQRTTASHQQQQPAEAAQQQSIMMTANQKQFNNLNKTSVAGGVPNH